MSEQPAAGRPTSVAHLIEKWREQASALRDMARANARLHPTLADGLWTRGGERDSCSDELAALVEAGTREPEPAICMMCDGCGWCEGSPAFTCPRCQGTGAAPPVEATVCTCRHDSGASSECAIHGS